jgi:Bacterial PH domain
VRVPTTDTCPMAVGGWRPALVVDDDGLTLRNPLRTVRLPWSQVQGVAMGWALTVTAAGVRHRVWAVPGPRRMQALTE